MQSSLRFASLILFLGQYHHFFVWHSSPEDCCHKIVKEKRRKICKFQKNDLPLHPQWKTNCPDGGIGGIGRRAGLKHQWSKIHPGSTPGLGTSKSAK